MSRRKKTAQKRESTIGQLLESYTAVEELKDEMSEWRDNMEGANMTNVPKFEEVQEAADTLDSAYSQLESAVDDITSIKDEKFEALLEVKVEYSYFPFGRKMSRSDRLADATEDVRRAYDRLTELLDSEEGLDPDVKRTAADALDEVEGALTELEAVSFPGMF